MPCNKPEYFIIHAVHLTKVRIDFRVSTNVDGPGICLGDGQTVAYLKDTDMKGLASAWAMARRRQKDYRCKVDAAMRCSGVCPHIAKQFQNASSAYFPITGHYLICP